MKLRVTGQALEKRVLNRIQVGFARDLSAIIYVNGVKYRCPIEDFHFMGIRLNLKDQRFESLKMSEISRIEICFGEKVISDNLNPQVIRYLPNDHLTLALQNNDRGEGFRGLERMHVKPSFKPVIIATDPVKIETVLNFEVLNLSASGFLLSTSLSNKHLLKGQQITNAQLLLPGVKFIPIAFSIRHMSVKGQRVVVGAELIRPSNDNLEALAQFAIFGTLPPAGLNIKEKYDAVKKSVHKIKKLGASVRCHVVSTPEDYAGVLRIRHEAYREAGKIADDLKVEDMADIYDNHSVILAARVDGAIVGTVRLVESTQKSDEFPFEDYLEFSEVLKAYPRNKIYEVSRLAVDPSFQGTDIVVRIFKETARITGLNSKTCVCLATAKLRPLYGRIGFGQISREVPHKTQLGETLALLMADNDEFLKGSKMSATAWDRVAREVAENLNYAGITKLSANKTKIRLMMQIEKYLLNIAKAVKSKRK